MKKFIGVLEGNVRIIIVLAVALLLITGWYGYQKVIDNPKNVFDRMLVNSLQTSSYARNSTQTDGAQSLTVDALQLLSPVQQVRTHNVLSQGENGGTNIVTENIATTDTSFVRYTSIATDQKKQSGEEFDFTDVIGIWGEAPAATGESSGNQLYSQNLVVPVANLTPDQRKKLLDQIFQDKVYTVDFNNATKQTTNGRPTYSYAVTVAPVAYINMLKTINSMYGIKDLDSLDANSYKDIQPLSFAFEIDVFSGQLKKITYQNNGLVEDYNSYGARANAEIPSNTIPLQELQSRLQQAQ